MKLIRIDVQENREQKYKKEEFITNVVEQIFLICKNDRNFQLEGSTKIDEEIENIKIKVNNKNQLIQKSNEMKKTIIEKINELENENKKIKNNLLESLGQKI